MTGRVKEMKEVSSSLTILRGFTAAEIEARALRYRKAFETACMKQGTYLPSEDTLRRWFA